jgi:hypothetical protein
MIRVVTLGCCCSATDRLKWLGLLNNEHCVFEWTMAIDIADVIRVLQKQCARAEHVDRRLLRIVGTGIVTRNYGGVADFEATFARRLARLRRWLASEDDRVLFVRHDGKIPTVEADLVELSEAIKGLGGVDGRFSVLLLQPPTVFRRRGVFQGCNSRIERLTRDDVEYVDVFARAVDDLRRGCEIHSEVRADVSLWKPARGLNEPPCGSRDADHMGIH